MLKCCYGYERPTPAQDRREESCNANDPVLRPGDLQGDSYRGDPRRPPGYAASRATGAGLPEDDPGGGAVKWRGAETLSTSEARLGGWIFVTRAGVTLSD